MRVEQRYDEVERVVGWSVEDAPTVEGLEAEGAPVVSVEPVEVRAGWKGGSLDRVIVWGRPIPGPRARRQPLVRAVVGYGGAYANPLDALPEWLRDLVSRSD